MMTPVDELVEVNFLRGFILSHLQVEVSLKGELTAETSVYEFMLSQHFSTKTTLNYAYLM